MSRRTVRGDDNRTTIQTRCRRPQSNSIEIMQFNGGDFLRSFAPPEEGADV